MQLKITAFKKAFIFCRVEGLIMADEKKQLYDTNAVERNATKESRARAAHAMALSEAQ